MTKEQARKELEGTWKFKLVGGKVALREVALIEAVTHHEHHAARPDDRPSLPSRTGKAAYY